MLCESYHKILGKSRPNAPIRMKNAMWRDLLWFIQHIAHSDGIHMLKSVEWSPYDRMGSTLIGFLDASGVGMDIWFLGEYTGFQCTLPANGPKDLIFFYEALVICSAFHLGANYGCDQTVVYTPPWIRASPMESKRTLHDFGCLCGLHTKIALSKD